MFVIRSRSSVFDCWRPDSTEQVALAALTLFANVASTLLESMDEGQDECAESLKASPAAGFSDAFASRTWIRIGEIDQT